MLFLASATTIIPLLASLFEASNNKVIVGVGVKTAAAQREQQKQLLPLSLPSSLLMYGYANGSSNNNNNMMINSSSSPSSYLSGHRRMDNMHHRY